MTRVVFWLASAAVAWTYGVFPLVAWARARFAPRPIRRAPITPSVTVIVPAHNEEREIGRKLESVLASDYPADCLEVIVASDGSTDRTVAVAAALGRDRVEVLDLPRAGKAAALHAAVVAALGEILVFTDANSLLDRSSLRQLVAPFADPQVGGVAGDQRYQGGPPEAGTPEGERSYWGFERRLKQWESIAGSTVSSTGALHAIRAELYRPVPAGLTDDFFISTTVIRRGRRLVFEPAAIAREAPAASTSDEFERKLRIATRILATEVALRELLDPRRHGFYAIQLLSHKPMRQLMFVPLALIAIATPTLVARGRIYRMAAAAQLAVYGLGAAGLALGDRARSRLVTLPAYFCMAYAAQAVAVVRLMRGERVASWSHRRGAPAAAGHAPSESIAVEEAAVP